MLRRILRALRVHLPWRALPGFAVQLTLTLTLTACLGQPATPTGPVGITINFDGETRSLTSAGPTVREALAQAGITLGRDDKVQPPEFTRLTDGLAIQVIRVTEELVVEESVLPFERQTVRNEGLPAGETRLLQIGVNGVQEITYRLLYEDGVQVARNIVKQQVIVEPAPEIVMIGAQSASVSVPVSGSLAYIDAGNAWLMRGNSGSRRPLTVSGDLDGRVFALSPDGGLLLFTRILTDTEAAETFNTLWMIDAKAESARPIDLDISNVLWADWSPAGVGNTVVPAATVAPAATAGATPGVTPTGPAASATEPSGSPARAYSFAYSTAEPRPTAPGWQANNDLLLVQVDTTGRVRDTRRVLDASSGGVYGWWGTTFAWAPDGRALAYSQADTVGMVQVTTEFTPTLQPLLVFPLYQTYSDWVWTPTVAWSADQRFIYTVVHAPPVRQEQPEDSPAFDVAVLGANGGPAYSAALVQQAGIWAGPVPSPAVSDAVEPLIAFLQAISPLESVNSRYYLAVMDRDGSNSRRLFPVEGEIGLNPQTVAWSPDARTIAVIRSGNLWVVDLDGGNGAQLTSDGFASKPAWAE